MLRIRARGRNIIWILHALQFLIIGLFFLLEKKKNQKNRVNEEDIPAIEFGNLQNEVEKESAGRCSLTWQTQACGIFLPFNNNPARKTT